MSSTIRSYDYVIARTCFYTAPATLTRASAVARYRESRSRRSRWPGRPTHTACQAAPRPCLSCCSGSAAGSFPSLSPFRPALLPRA
eukprot:365977-Chlamydomonas_euryale.AAC.6